MKSLNILSAIAAGVIATIAMTVMMMMGPMMGLPKMEIAKMLSMFMGLPLWAGWAAHFMIGTGLALFYAVVFANRLPFNRPIRGMIYGIVPWLMAQLIVMPIMGMGLFSGSVVMAGGSLMGHLLYGAVLGSIYRAHCVEGIADCNEHTLVTKGSAI